MDLPNDEIGVSDILSWRDCPRRMSFSMRRWTDEGEPPEATNESNAYGSAIHLVFHSIEEDGLSDDEAIQRAFGKYGGHLWPHDLVRMKADLETYHQRDNKGVRLIGSEVSIRVPLLKHPADGRTIYFRGQIDRLYERVGRPGHFIHRDYKSSAWPKTREEVDADLQMWAYNWGIHEFWPECESLVQIYDQLNAGEIDTRKSDVARKRIKEWLQRQVMAILLDDPADGQGDGLLAPKFNEWCPWCPIMESCKVVPQLSEFAKTRITALSADEDLDASKIEEYVQGLEDAATARKMLERYEKRVKALVRELPPEEQDRLGFYTQQRRNTVWSSDALEAIHEMLGEEFYSLAGITKTRIEDYLAGDPRLERILALARKEPGPIVVARKRT
jgi:hypothetical protein